MEILAVGVIVLGIVVCRHIVVRARKRARYEEAVLTRIAQYANL
jgi:hypothetical protein